MKGTALSPFFLLGPNAGFASDKCLFSTLSSWGHTWSNHSQMLVVYIEREAETHREQKSIENTPIPPRICWAPPSPAGSLLAQPWAVDPWSLLLPACQSWFCTFFPTPLQGPSASRWEPKISEGVYTMKIGQCNKLEIPFLDSHLKNIY